MLLFDASHTSHTRARTGVQRVVRAMFAALKDQHEVAPVCFDPHQEVWRSLEPWETEILTDTTSAGSAHRSARWPLSVRLNGYARRLLNARSACPAGDALLVPEIFSAKIGRAYPELFARVSGPRVAIFHDAIALKLPEFTPAKTVARFPAYLHELLAFDGIAAVSEDSRQSLLDYWRWLGVANPPPVAAITNAIAIPCVQHVPDTVAPWANAVPTILCVGSIEGRKNHLALLAACEQLWTQGRHFQLRLIGLAHPQTGRAALEKIASLQAAGRSLRYDGPVDDAALAVAYDACTFTVYPSLMEGFGLPVQESLAHGKPCICSKLGAIGESGRSGGCQTLDKVDAQHLAEAIDRWLSAPGLVENAARDARLHKIKTWPNYAQELMEWISALPRREHRT
jgi:glycosyltransferase involved in cell wall biosynthesis